MPDLLIRNVEPELYERLEQAAREQGKTLPQLAFDILAAADRARDKFDSEPFDSTKFIRRMRDGGCGFCDEIELLLTPPKVAVGPS